MIRNKRVLGTALAALAAWVFAGAICAMPLLAQEATATIHVTAQQGEGYAAGKAFLSKHETWEEAGVQKERWDAVSDRNLSQGTATFQVAPGTYRIAFEVGGTRQTTKPFEIAGAGQQTFNFDVATIDVVAQQAVGVVAGRVWLSRQEIWQEAGVQKERWDSVADRNLSQGTTTLYVAPGVYRIALEVGDTWQRTAPFEIAGTDRQAYHFDVATIDVVAQQAEGDVAGRVWLSRQETWQEAGVRKHRWDAVDDRKLSQGTATFHVAPGVYRAVLRLEEDDVALEAAPFTLAGIASVRIGFDVAGRRAALTGPDGGESTAAPPDETALDADGAARLAALADELDSAIAELEDVIAPARLARLKQIADSLHMVADPSDAGLPQEIDDGPSPDDSGGDSGSVPAAPPAAESTPTARANGSLELVVTTPLLQVFSLGTETLQVTIDGPVRRTETVAGATTATPYVIAFPDIPQGTYQVTATYGNTTLTRTVTVGSGETLEIDWVML